MAQVKLTATFGKPRIASVALAAGTPIAGSDAMELNIDATRMTKSDALIAIEALRAKIFASPWPMM